ncbi:hypothetical protein J8I26_16985 [Herbaspirillum sp. LeCh32-8]|uniref:hypothetical protein n=1 Tax=Herbaspirillum sp. LeCh32-8 TaxID=2821356 RepID=UPI001AE1B086|nr:hypothetical protein [Herbaspirillum sp. LeCh32-8]MBP0599808.1 hypothetical protein [Herbaspirillum sp. LeCh32-8]
MKKRLFWLAMLLLSAGAAHAERTVMLEQDMGCDSVEVQQMRVQLTRIIMNTDNEQSKDEATRRIVDLTQQHCVALSGIFPITGKASGLLKVTTREGRDLWLVE